MKIIYVGIDVTGKHIRVVERESDTGTFLSAEIKEHGQWLSLLAGEYKYAWVLEQALMYYFNKSESLDQTVIDFPAIKDSK